MKKLVLAFIVSVLLGSGGQALAGMDTVRFQEQLNALNRIDPLQNPQNKSSDEIFKRRIIDQKSRIIGQVKDVVLKLDDGEVSFLEVDFDRLRLGQNVMLSYQDMKIRGTSNLYQLALKSDEVETIFPKLLAGTQTASGIESDIISVKNLIGKPLQREDGRRIGSIKDVMFHKDGGMAEAIYVSLDAGTLRNVGVAVPLKSLTMKDDRGRISAQLPNDQVDLLLEYAKKL